MNFFDKIYAQTKKIVADANFSLRNDVVNLLRSAYKSEKNKKLFDFFRNRLMFPIIQNDQVKSFGGRILPKFEGKKYSMNVTDLAKGIYLLRISTNEENFTRKFVKN